MKFDVVVGNPPYQENNNDNNRDNPIYQHFYDLAKKVSDEYVLISPARFLFNVGQTAKAWNEQMLKDEHLSVVYFNQKSSEVFPNTDIKGGVAIIYRSVSKDFGAIETFASFEELNSIMHKVIKSDFENLSDLIFVRSSYKFTDLLLKEQPELKNRVKGNEQKSMGSNVFDRYPEVFFDEKPDTENYIQIYGRQSNERVYKFVKSSYVKDGGNLNGWKVFVPKSNGTGAIGEALSTPVIGYPAIGHTQTFISIGNFETKEEAKALLKYLKTKFARVMLGIKKITQDNATKETWSKVPLQNFTPNSDINWNLSISEIDRQLYEKYNLDQNEIDFIESKVKAME